MKNKFLVALMAILTMIVVPVYSEILNGYTVINDGLYVYTNTEWDGDILAKNNLQNKENILDRKIDSSNNISYDYNFASQDKKIEILYEEMIENAQQNKIDLNTLVPDFISKTNDVVQDDAELILKRDNLLKNTTYANNNVTYIIKKQKFITFVDNIQKSTSLLKNGLYYINGINFNNMDAYYIVYVVGSKIVTNCFDKASGYTFNDDGYACNQDGSPIIISNINDTMIGSYNVINNTEEYINSQREKHEKDVQKANNYNNGGNWMLDSSTATDMLTIEGTGGPGKNLESKINANIKYDIKTINVPLSTKNGRGTNSPYYNERNVEINNVNLKYTDLKNDNFNLCYGVYEVEKEEAGDYEYDNKAEHIVFERNEKKAASEMNIKTSNASYLLLNLKLNKKIYINSQLIVYKDGTLSQDITLDSAKKDVLIDVSDCSTVKFEVKPISKHIDVNVNNKTQDNVVFEPGRYVKQGTYSKNYIENNNEASNFFEYNDMRLYADVYLIF